MVLGQKYDKNVKEFYEKLINIIVEKFRNYGINKEVLT